MVTSQHPKYEFSSCVGVTWEKMPQITIKSAIIAIFHSNSTFHDGCTIIISANPSIFYVFIVANTYLKRPIQTQKELAMD